MNTFLINSNDRLPKAHQIKQAIISDIENGLLKKNERLPSINSFSKQFKVARDTVEKAYKRLKDEGYIVAVPGKGNYIAEETDDAIKILLIMNKISQYKKQVYESFIEELGKAAKVDLEIHHYDPKILKRIIGKNKGGYHYYVIMPHFLREYDEAEYLEVLNSIPAPELVLLDRQVSLNSDKHISVYQDFKMDVFEAFEKELALFDKYDSLNVIISVHKTYPEEIKDGIELFCKKYKKKFQLIRDLNKVLISPRQVYISLTESELVDIVKKVRSSEFAVGKDVGLISFNETDLKDLLGITVVSTDFAHMGRLAAKLILEKRHIHVRNKFNLIKRDSL